MSWWAEQYTYQHAETDNQQGRHPRPRPHRTQEGQPQFPCDIILQYGIISTVMIPVVPSGATWTLSLRNFLWTWKTQVQSTFVTDRTYSLLLLVTSASYLPMRTIKLCSVLFGAPVQACYVGVSVWGSALLVVDFCVLVSIIALLISSSARVFFRQA